MISGLLTYQKLCKLHTEDDEGLVPAIVLPRRPVKDVLRLLMLNDIVRPLLKQFVNVTGDTVTQLLSTLFVSVEQPSVLKNAENGNLCFQ
ncbi:hypothetical protein [Shewanella morhuae]|uniref:Uncharacterized protein n=1 Tax=Shewanella morhuae TaxID=365591 RepID=A0A380A2E7_9GAMM|nr:hypothetical protein [Shewanella morhuae]SUI72183.1 Uncharacterised protein [Shewanella morhuae]